MDLASSLRSFRPQIGRSSRALLEGVLALSRLWIAVGILILASVNPSGEKFSLNAAVDEAFAFAIYSVLVLYFLSGQKEYSPRLGFTFHCLDLVWIIPLIHFAPGMPASLLLLVLFILGCAAQRWGAAGTLATAAGALVLLEASPLLPGWTRPGPGFAGMPFLGSGLSITRFIFGLFVGGFFVLLAEKETERRWEAAAEAAQCERARISRELHDGAIQLLYTLDCRMEKIRSKNQTLPVSVTKELNLAKQLLRQTEQELRAVVQQGRMLDFTSKTFLEYLSGLTQQFQRETGITVQLISECNQISLPPSVTHELACVIREALVNVMKHSGAHNVIVRVSVDREYWKIVIEDDGRGFDFSGRLHMAEMAATKRGPFVIRERLTRVGGDLEVESVPGCKARLEIALPKANHD